MNFLRFLSSLLLLAGLAFGSVPAKRLPVSAARLAAEAATIGNQVDFLLDFFRRLIYSPLFYGSTPEDPAPFKDFTYSFAGLFSAGESNITNSVIVGTSKYERRLTINREREEINLHIEFPQLSLIGNYSLNHTAGGCLFGCYYTYYTGNGGYNHTFTGVTFDGKYTLDHSTDPDPFGYPSIRYTPKSFAINATGVSLYADNFRVDDVLQTNWEERSQKWAASYLTDEYQTQSNNIMLGEASAIVLNYSSRLLFKTVEEIFEELIGFGAEFIP